MGLIFRENRETKLGLGCFFVVYQWKTMLLTTFKDNLSYYLGLIRPSPTQTNGQKVWTL